MHRNTFLDSPRLLDSHFRLRKEPRIRFAGQITGVEGYIESAASGIYAGLTLARELSGQSELTLPTDSMLGALSHYISDETVENFQPMGCNMGILPPLGERIRNKQLRYETVANRGLASFKQRLTQELSLIHI